MTGALLHVGTCARPHGITGELCVDWHAGTPELLRGLFYLQLGAQAPVPVDGADVRMHKGRPLLRLPHVRDRNVAESLRGARILLPRASLPPLPEDEAYLADIIGLSVTDHSTNTRIGVLERVSFPAGQQLWHIMTPEGREVLFPAVPQFIVHIDPTEGARIAPPPGLLELYL